MIVKTFEVRDSGTFMPVLAIKLTSTREEDRYLLARAGFGTTPFVQAGYVLLHPMCYTECSYDEFFWTKNGTRTLSVAHAYIQKNFEELESGEVIDVEYILGETTEIKKSERISCPI